MMAETALFLFLGLLALLLLAYIFNPRFRAEVDADTARRQRKHRRGRRAPLADAEIWPDPPADPAAFDRWFETHGTSEDPRTNPVTGPRAGD